MKIAYLLNHLDAHGGIEKITAQKITAWIEIYGYEVVLITKKQDHEYFVYPVHEKCTHINLNINNEPGRKYLKNLKNYFKLKNELNKILKKEKIDILFTTVTSIDALLIPFVGKGIPKVLEYHHSGIYLPQKSWTYKKYFVEKYDKAVVLNQDETQYYNLRNVTIIPNFIDEIRADISNSAAKRKIIISVGRIDEIKQFDHMIEIWSMIFKPNNDWQFHVYGNGNEMVKKQLLTLIEKHGLTNSFKIFPATSDIASKLKEALIFVQTSASECFPMVLLEAMQAQLPIVSYDSPNGPRNIITSDKDGILVPLNDKNKLGKELQRLISNENLRNELVKNQAEKINKFSQKNIMEMWNKLVLDLLKKKDITI